MNKFRISFFKGFDWNFKKCKEFLHILRKSFWKLTEMAGLIYYNQ